MKTEFQGRDATLIPCMQGDLALFTEICVHHTQITMQY